MIVTDHLLHWMKSNKVKKQEITATIENVLKHLKTLKSDKDISEFVWSKIDASNKKNNLMEQSTCKKGCSFCCHQEILTSSIEMEKILNYVEQEGIEIDLEKIHKQVFLKKLSPKEKRCVFLDKHGDCKIYPVRPATCRNYYVTSHKHICKKKYVEPSLKVSGRLEIAINYESHIYASALYNLPLSEPESLTKKLALKLLQP